MASRSTNRTLAAALTRGDRSTIGRWFWTIDKTLLIIIFALVAAGIVAVAAASPAAARRLSGTALRFDDLYFLYRQLGWVALGLPLMLATSMLDMRLLKRLAVIGTLGCLVALLLVGQSLAHRIWWSTPDFVRDYIIYHELMHLREMNHSARFWARVAEVCPGWQDAERWIKRNGSVIGL